MGFAWMGRRMTLRQELAAEALLGPEGRGALLEATRNILLFTFVAEASGSLLLTTAFAWHGEPWSAAAFRGVFTAISAFCKAGFALQSDSLVGYADSPLVLHTVAALIVVGGLSPASVLAIPGLVRPRGRPRRLRYLLPLVVSLALSLAGILAVLVLEWQGTLRSLGSFERLNNAWFQSITLRTAGFNSLDFAALGHRPSRCASSSCSSGAAPRHRGWYQDDDLRVSSRAPTMLCTLVS
jgi:trk system potassium uptake protein TrkH